MQRAFAFITILLLTPTTAAGDATNPWNVGAVRAELAPAPVPDRRIVVAVLDSGVYPNADALRGTTVLKGRNFVDPEESSYDDNGHGTHVASLIAGSIGPSGPLCPECVILPVKVLDDRGLGDARTLAQGLIYAADNGADVVNMSMGFDPGYEPGAALADAVAYAREHGVVLVASVGNEGRAGATYPAAYPGVIAVAAVDYDGHRTAYSNVSPAVDVAAPGGDDRDRDGDGVPESILSDGLTLHGGTGAEPWLYSGTSQAAAHVSALAGRLLALGVAPDDVSPIMTDTAQDVGPAGFDVGTGAGLIDFPNALERGHEVVAQGGTVDSWDESYRWQAREVQPRMLEVTLSDRDGRTLAGGTLFGHWKGTRRVLVLAADSFGKIILPMEGIRPEDLHIDRILPGSSTVEAESFLTKSTRPYEGILASPLSRYPR